MVFFIETPYLLFATQYGFLHWNTIPTFHNSVWFSLLKHHTYFSQLSMVFFIETPYLLFTTQYGFLFWNTIPTFHSLPWILNGLIRQFITGCRTYVLNPAYPLIWTNKSHFIPIFTILIIQQQYQQYTNWYIISFPH